MTHQATPFVSPLQSENKAASARRDAEHRGPAGQALHHRDYQAENGHDVIADDPVSDIIEPDVIADDPVSDIIEPDDLADDDVAGFAALDRAMPPASTPYLNREPRELLDLLRHRAVHTPSEATRAEYWAELSRRHPEVVAEAAPSHDLRRVTLSPTFGRLTARRRGLWHEICVEVGGVPLDQAAQVASLMMEIVDPTELAAAKAKARKVAADIRTLALSRDRAADREYDDMLKDVGKEPEAE